MEHCVEYKSLGLQPCNARHTLGSAPLRPGPVPPRYDGFTRSFRPKLRGNPRGNYARSAPYGRRFHAFCDGTAPAGFNRPGAGCVLRPRPYPGSCGRSPGLRSCGLRPAGTLSLLQPRGKPLRPGDRKLLRSSACAVSGSGRVPLSCGIRCGPFSVPVRSSTGRNRGHPRAGRVHSGSVTERHPDGKPNAVACVRRRACRYGYSASCGSRRRYPGCACRCAPASAPQPQQPQLAGRRPAPARRILRKALMPQAGAAPGQAARIFGVPQVGLEPTTHRF